MDRDLALSLEGGAHFARLFSVQDTTEHQNEEDTSYLSHRPFHGEDIEFWGLGWVTWKNTAMRHVTLGPHRWKCFLEIVGGHELNVCDFLLCNNCLNQPFSRGDFCPAALRKYLESSLLQCTSHLTERQGFVLGSAEVSGPVLVSTCFQEWHSKTLSRSLIAILNQGWLCFLDI